MTTTQTKPSAAATAPEAPAKISKETFVLRAIETLRKDNKPNKKTGKVSLGIHVVYSGFNEAFRMYFDGADPRETTDAMKAAGLIVLNSAYGGAMIYLPGDAVDADARTASNLAKLGLAAL